MTTGECGVAPVFAMGRSADQRWSKPVLAELESRDPAMRFEATASAGELGLVAAVQRLVQLMDDADSSISEAAALALGKIGGRAAKRALEEALLGSDERLTQAAEEALEELTFNNFDFEERSGDRAEGSRRRRTGEADEIEDEGFFDEDEGYTRLSQDVLQEDEDSWDEEEDDPLYWLDEDEDEEDEEDEEDGYLDGPDLFPGPATVPSRDRDGTGTGLPCPRHSRPSRPSRTARGAAGAG